MNHSTLLAEPIIRPLPRTAPSETFPEWLVPLIQKVGASDPITYLAHNSRSFRFATRFLPEGEALKIAEVYAFCRFTDDLVDSDANQTRDQLQARLRDWTELAHLAYLGHKTGISLLDQPMGRMGRSRIPFTYVTSLIEGMQMDIDHRPYRTMRDLKRYTFRVAGIIGQWLTDMVGVHHTWAFERAADLGHAMQVTNIIRDVGEDWRQGRFYLPMDLLDRHGLNLSDIDQIMRSASSPPPAYIALMEDMMAEAEGHYRRAMQGIPSLPGFFQKPVLVAALVYRSIHSALRANRYDNFRKRAQSSAFKKFQIGLHALWLLPTLKFLFPPIQSGILPRDLAYEP